MKSASGRYELGIYKAPRLSHCRRFASPFKESPCVGSGLPSRSPPFSRRSPPKLKRSAAMAPPRRRPGEAPARTTAEWQSQPTRNRQARRAARATLFCRPLRYHAHRQGRPYVPPRIRAFRRPLARRCGSTRSPVFITALEHVGTARQRAASTRLSVRPGPTVIVLRTAVVVARRLTYGDRSIRIVLS